MRAAPGVLIHPLEEDFGWGRADISFAVSIGLLLYGLSGPAAGAIIERIGPRRLMLAGIVLTAISSALAALVNELWQLNLVWGVLSGIGTGATATVLGATVATRWFVARRGLVLGIFGAAVSAGQLVFVPGLMWLVTTAGWREASVLLAVCTVALLPLVVLLMRDNPASIGLQPYGGPHPVDLQIAADGQSCSGVGRATRTPEFWLLFGSFFVCGATSTGLIGTHFIPHSIDHGIPEKTAAGTLALMGAMNFVGTIASGWLTDRHDPRKLLAIYYSLRGVSLFVLPFVTGFSGLALFAIVFGLDYIATVPPTASLVADVFGRRHVAAIYGWVFFGHQLGAALAAYLGGIARDTLGDYTASFIAAGVLAIAASVMALLIDRRPSTFGQPVPASA